MTQRLRTSNGLNLETVVCEKYMARLLENDLKFKTNSVLSNNRSREKNSKLSCVNPIVKPKACNKPVPYNHRSCQSPRSSLDYSDDTALVKVTVKAPHPRQRSKNRAIDQEPWGQILKYEKSNDKLSVFNNFDPLRTLHFLIKELELHLQRVLSEVDGNNISQIIQDMQAALKRVPPEVASIIHLQQACDVANNIILSEKETQTCSDGNENLKKNFEENISKFEIKYGELESICNRLRNEKYEMEKQLLVEKETAENYKQKIEDLEKRNNSFLAPRIRNLENEKERLESDIDCLALNYETRYTSLVNELRSQISEVKTAKSSTEQENQKLKHQIRVMNIEKEKYVTVLAARDRQINEIRNEMTHLQEAVNEQLMELQKNAAKTFPNTSMKSQCDLVKKENIGDWSVSLSNNDHDELHKYSAEKSVKDLPSGDVDNPENFVEYHSKYPVKEKNVISKQEDDLNTLLERIDSHTSIRSLFNEVKKTALSIANCPNYQFNAENDRKT